MLLVNFLGSYSQTVPEVIRHHNTYCSYADTIMPQFFFAVGYAFRLTFLRRLGAMGSQGAYWAVIRRNFGLILLGVVYYHLDGEVKSWAELRELGVLGFIAQAFRRDPFETLVHIALASLWIMPVIAASPLVRVGFLIFSALLHLGLSAWFYFDWAWRTPVIDGGQIGFMSWAIPTLVGSLAYDLVVAAKPGMLARLVGWSIVLMAIGYLMTGFDGVLDPPPFVPPAKGTVVNMWTMSQRTGSVSYLMFSAGFSLAVYALFVVLCDMGPVRVGLFRTFGQNPLAAYLIHGIVAGAVKPYLPSDVPVPVLTAGFLIYFGISYLFVRHLEKHQLFLRL
jgi:predicted acyltransferase